MDKVKPLELEGVTTSEAFGESSESIQFHLKSVAERRRNEKIKPLVIDIPLPVEDEVEMEEEKCHQPETKIQILSDPPAEPPPPPSPQQVPKILITPHFDPFPFATFEYLGDISTFVMTHTGKATAKVTTPLDVEVFKCDFSQSTYWEGCHPETKNKQIRIYEGPNSKMVMELRYMTPPCNSCFEEEMNRIEIFGADERLMATIIQKKSWVGSRVDREVLLEPGPYGKSNTYTANFTWNDASINFKANRSGIIVATLMTDCAEKGRESNYVLQCLREICPRDKAMLVAFMLARDTLMTDESQTRQFVERVTMFIFIIAFIAICSYFFHPSKIPKHHL